jgi:malate/lactate dehydrogenase
MRHVKVVIVGGGGGTGSSTAFNLLLQQQAVEVVMLDAREAMVTSHVMDFEQVLELAPGATVRAGDADDVATADVLVVTAAAPLTVNTSRLVYLEDNARILESIARLIPPSWAGVAVIVTNPVDALVTWFQRRTGLDRRRVVGYTINDSLRLRTGLARELGLPAGAVEAWAIGEHGDAFVPLLDRVTVGGSPRVPTEAEAAAALGFVRTWYVRHVALDSGRSSTWTTGLGVSRMVRAILDGDGGMWPASVVLDGEYGLRSVAVSVPVLLGRGGAESIVELELTADQREALHAAAALVRDLSDGIGAPAAPVGESAHT